MGGSSEGGVLPISLETRNTPERAAGMPVPRAEEAVGKKEERSKMIATKPIL
jgi:hypothetical protein